MHDAPSYDRADGAVHARSIYQAVYPVVPPPVQHAMVCGGAHTSIDRYPAALTIVRAH